MVCHSRVFNGVASQISFHSFSILVELDHLPSGDLDTMTAIAPDRSIREAYASGPPCASNWSQGIWATIIESSEVHACLAMVSAYLFFGFIRACLWGEGARARLVVGVRRAPPWLAGSM